MLHRSLLPLFALTLFSCDVPPGTSIDDLAAAATGDAPEIDFAAKPSYIANNIIALTFDDGPDYASTPKVLDILKANNVKATFFVNTINWVNVDKEQQGKDLIKRIVAEGHSLANHTVHHPHLGGMTPDQIEAEIAGVEKTVAGILGEGAPKLTLFRTPYGEPYAGAAPGDATVKKVAAVVSKHAVHIGWAADTLDWSFKPGDADKVLASVQNLMKKPGQGAYGAILMHCVQPQTAAALQRVLDYLKGAGFQFALVEDLVKAKYGKSSAELIYGPGAGTGGAGGAGGTGGAGGGGAGGTTDDASAGGTGGAGGSDDASADDSGTGGTGGTGGSGAGGSGGTGPSASPDASAGHGGTGGGGSGGTGGEGGTSTGDGDTGGSAGGHSSAKSGGCTYGGAPRPVAWLSLLAATILIARRRRRS
jgi:peptidoglycan/xylan/chitin deacetylase (PgdA/CDA1 family)